MAQFPQIEADEDSIFDNLGLPPARFTPEEALARRDALNASFSVDEL